MDKIKRQQLTKVVNSRLWAKRAERKKREGEMSMIGPRPIRKKFADQLAALDPAYDRRFAVRPGLTGYAQIYAPYGSNVDEQLQKIPFDRRYADKALTVGEYMSLLLRTLWHCTVKPAGR